MVNITGAELKGLAVKDALKQIHFELVDGVKDKCLNQRFLLY